MLRKPIPVLSAVAVLLLPFCPAQQQASTAANATNAKEGATVPGERGRILGIGGIFFKSANQQQTREWYSKHLGLADKGAGANTALLAHGPDAERQLYTTYLASSFRALRFGLQDHHAKGMAIQFNYFLDHGAFIANAYGTFRVDISKMKDAVASLDRIFLTLEATGDYAGTKQLIGSMMVLRPETQQALDRLKSVPTDIEPLFVTADALAKEGVKP